MIRCSRVLGAVLVACVGLPGVSVAQEGLRVKLAGPGVGVSFYGHRFAYGATVPQQTTTYRQWLDLGLSGSVVHPDILSFSVSALPTWIQGRYLPRIDTVTTDGSGDTFSGTARLQFFRTMPVAGEVTAMKAQGFQRFRFGGAGNHDVIQWAASLRDKDPMLQSELSYEVQDSHTEFTNAIRQSPHIRDELVRRLRYRAVNSKTRVLLEQSSFRRRAEDIEFTRRDGQLQHTLAWGKGSRMLSRVRYLERVGSFAFRSFGWNELVRLQQADAVHTTLETGMDRSTTPSGDARHLLGRSTVTVGAAGKSLAGQVEVRNRRTQGVSIDMLRAGPSGSLTLGLAGRASLTLDLDAAYLREAQRSEGDAWGEEVAERQVVGASGVVQLNRTYADPGSVRVFGENGTDLYDEGFDYRIVQSGPFTEIHLLPGGRILTGATLTIGYRYQMVPALDRDALAVRYNVRLSLGILELWARRDRLQALDEVVVEDRPFVRNFDRTDLGAELAWLSGPASVNLVAASGRSRGDGYDVRNRSFQASVTAGLATGLTATTTGRLLASRGDSVRYDSHQAELRVDWSPISRLRLGGSVSYWTWDDMARHERFVGAGASVAWAAGVRKPRTLNLAYDWVNWGNGVLWNEHRISISVTQKF